MNRPRHLTLVPYTHSSQYRTGKDLEDNRTLVDLWDHRLVHARSVEELRQIALAQGITVTEQAA